MNLSFFMRKCIYECIYNVCLNESFSIRKVFMNAWFFLDLFFLILMHAKKIKLECIYKWNFWECIYIVQNAKKIHKILCEYIYRCMKIYVFLIFNFFLISWMVMHEWILEIIFLIFLMICMNECSTFYFSDFFYFF